MRHLLALLAGLLFAGNAWADGIPFSISPPYVASNVAITGGTISGSDLSGAVSTATGAGSQYITTMANIAAQSGILLDVFAQSGDTDDTPSLTRACAAGVPIQLRAKTYTFNNFSCSASPFILTGIQGASVLQRGSASAGASSFTLTGANVYIKGVTFDFNKANVTANQWGVLLNAGGQTVYVANSVFKNNSGTLGSGFSLLSTGPGAGGSFTFINNEVTGCTFDSAYFGSVSNGYISGNLYHDNTSFGLLIAANGAASSTNYSTNIISLGDRARNNTLGIQVGGIGAPYNFAQNWPASYVTIQNAIAYDNTTYQITNQGDHVDIINPTITQINAGSVSTGIGCPSRNGRIIGGSIYLSNATYGIDCGGAIEPSIQGTKITMSTGNAVNIGGTQNATIWNDIFDLTGSAVGITDYATEADGSGVAFPTGQTLLSIEHNQFNMAASGTKGIIIFDDAGGWPSFAPTTITDNDFNLTNSASSANAIYYYAAGKAVYATGNRVNGSYTTFQDPNNNNDVVFDTVYDSIQTSSSVGPIRSFINGYMNTYGGGGTILYAFPTAGGSGYTAATVLTETCSVTNPTSYTATALINAGVIYGARLSGGTGCSGTPTVTASDAGGGSGAVFTASATPQVPFYKKLTFISGPGFNTLPRGGGLITLSASGSGAIFDDANTRLSLDSGLSAASWSLVGGQPPTLSFSGASSGSCTGYISGNTMACTAGQTGIALGHFVTISGGVNFTRISAGSGNTWTVYPSQTVASVGSPIAITTNALPPSINSGSIGTLGSQIVVTGTASGQYTARNNGSAWIFPNGSSVDLAPATTGSIGGGALLAGACASGTVAVTNSTTAMGVVATPAAYPGDGNYWMGYVSTNGTVTVKVCAAVAGTPTASAYNVRVVP